MNVKDLPQDGKAATDEGRKPKGDRSQGYFCAWIGNCSRDFKRSYEAN